MAGNVRTISRELYVQRCVRCGYDGALLSQRATRCAQCGCDLRRRPARSYAEMEGFTSEFDALDGADALYDDRPAAASRQLPSLPCMHGWLTFLAMLLVGILMVLYLVAAAMP